MEWLHRPCDTLEEYLMWFHQFHVKGLRDMVRADGNILDKHHWPTLTEQQFQVVLSYYEPFRSEIEAAILEHANHKVSWVVYAKTRFDFIPESVDVCAKTYLKMVTDE